MPFPWSLIQSNSGNSGGSLVTSLAVAYSSNVTQGNLLIAVLSSGNPQVGTTISSVTDTQGNTWTAAASTSDPFVTSTETEIWWAVAKATGANTATVNATSGCHPLMIVAEYNVPNAILDQTTGLNQSFTVPSHPITTAFANELIICGATDGLKYTTGWSINQSFVRDAQQNDVGFNACQGLFSLNAATSITTSPSPTHDGGTFTVIPAQASFRPGASVTVNCNNPPNGLVGVPYTNTFTASGGTAPYTFAISAGSLPPGLTLASNGVVSGVPTATGLYSFTVQATDAAAATGTVNCTINILPTGTLRFEIPQKRWFPHAYGDNIVTHYLDETFLGSVNTEQLLMLSSTLGFIYRSGGNTDNGTAILSAVTTPSMDGGIIRLQKLYVDVMTDLDGTGTLVANMQFNNQTINGTSVSYTVSGTRGQQLQNISSLSSLNLYRNASITYTWTGGPAGPRVYRAELAGYVQPYISTFWVTQFINLAFPGWKHHRRLYAGYISNSTLLFTIKTQDGRTYGPYTLPSTTGQFKIIPIMLDQDIKDLAFAYQIDGQGNNFVLFPDAWTIETKEWTEPSYLPLAIFNT